MTTHSSTKPWIVVRQTSSTDDVEVCAHRWEFTAELCSSRRERRDRSSATAGGVFYTARRRPDAEEVPA